MVVIVCSCRFHHIIKAVVLPDATAKRSSQFCGANRCDPKGRAAPIWNHGSSGCCGLQSSRHPPHAPHWSQLEPGGRIAVVRKREGVDSRSCRTIWHYGGLGGMGNNDGTKRVKRGTSERCCSKASMQGNAARGHVPNFTHALLLLFIANVKETDSKP